MLTPLKRRSVFKSSSFNDHIISRFQQSYGSDLDASVSSERKLLDRYYDHLTPFTPGYDEPTSHCVIAYDTESRLDYLKNFPRQLSFFLLQLGITEQFLLRFTDTNLLTEFPFENFTKKNRFKRLGAIKEPNTAYVVKTENVEKLLPLFFFSGVFDIPVIFLLAASGSVPLSLRLCDDGNLHLNYEHKDEDTITTTAQNLGFITGDIDVCTEVNIYRHR